MKKLPNIFVCIFILLLSQPLFAQEFDYSFRYLDQQKGLPDHIIFDIKMDSEGLIWFASQNGLMRWDGSQLFTFVPDQNDPTSIEGLTIKEVVEDNKGNFWIAVVGGGLDKYDRITNTFQHHRHDSENPNSLSGDLAVSLYEDIDGNIWVGTFNEGFTIFDPAAGTFKRQALTTDLTSGDDAFQRNSVSSFYQSPDAPHLMWIGAHNGLHLYDQQTEKVTYFPSTLPGSENVTVNKIYPDSLRKDIIWLATFGVGIVEFNTQSKTWNYHLKPEWKNSTGISGAFAAIAPKSKTEFWYASPSEGSGVFNTQTHTYTSFDPYAPKKNNIYHEGSEMVYEDPEGRVWFVHRGKAISYSSGGGKLFQYQEIGFGNCGQNTSFNEIADFAYDQKNQRIYVAGSACDGLFIMDKNMNMLGNVQLEGHENKPLIYKSLLIDKAGNLWVGAKSIQDSEGVFPPSLLKLNPATGKLAAIQHPVLDQYQVQKSTINSILEDQKGNIWIASDPAGLLRIRGDQIELFDPFTKEDRKNGRVTISQIILDEEDGIWVATRGNGTFYFKDGDFTQLHREGYKLDNINNLLLDQEGSLWLGHGNGLVKVEDPLNPEGAVTFFDEQHSYPGAGIDKLLMDAEGNIWTTTFKGLILYDSQLNSFVSFDEYDGLQEKLFFRNGFRLLPDGSFLLGQKGGFYTFNPAAYFAQKSQPKLIFSSIATSGSTLELEKNINYIDKVQLNYDQNFFTINYSLLEYDRPEKTNYQYILEGFDNEWNQASNRSFASYTNVREGTYTFRVKAADKKLQSAERVLEITIAPPWYRSFLAYLLYGLVILGIGTLLFQYQKRRWKLRTQLQLQEQEANKLKELDLAKTRLYTNITHEFRTPLTVIKGLTDEISGNDSIRKVITRNSDHLLNLINQMLDLSKLESGHLQLHNIQSNVITFINYLVESFHSLALSKDLTLSFHAEIDELTMDYDPEKLRQLLTNLISNAVKFTPAYGKIYVRAKEEDNHLIMTVKDTGVGIPPDKLDHIFNRFYQVDDSETRTQQGTGIGLALVNEIVQLKKGTIQVESEVSKGTSFKISIPITRTAPLVESSATSVPAPVPLAAVPSLGEEIAISDDHADHLPLLLIIEDSPDIVDYIRMCLSGFYRIDVATNGKIGIEKALATIPDIIISDVMMPIKNGYEVCEALKSNQASSHIPIILLTAKSDTDARLEGLHAGADAYLTKPFNKEELLVRLKNLIAVRKTIMGKYKDLDLSKAELIEDNIKDPEIIFLSQLEETVKANMDNEDFKVNPHLCRAMMMSRPQLYRKVKALLDLSPSDYIRGVRMKEAQKLLKSTNLKIGDIADKVGFKDQSYFTKVFVSEFGTTPAETRN